MIEQLMPSHFISYLRPKFQVLLQPDAGWRINSYCLFLIFFLSFAYFFQSGEHNENARFSQLRGFIETGQLNLTTYVHNTADIITVNQKFFPNKAPGMFLPALPVYFFCQILLKVLPLATPIADNLTCYLTTALMIGGLSALLATLLFRLLRQLSQNEVFAILLSFGFGFGTIAFPFSTLFFGHQFTACLIFASFYLLFQMRANTDQAAGTLHNSRAVKLKLFFAGLLLAVASSTEYPCVIGLGLVSLYALAIIRPATSLKYFVIGAIAGILPLFIYNYICFGSPLFITYNAYAGLEHSPFPAHAHGLAGVRVPDFETLWKITFDPQRGLFFYNPWLLALIPALLLVPFQKRNRAENILSAAMVVAFLAFNAGYGDGLPYWGGASSTGPRHIIPMLPFAVILIQPLLRYRIVRISLVPLGLLSCSIMLMATAVEPRVPYEYSNPVLQFFWPHFFSGRLALLEYGTYNNQLLTYNSVAFNIGKLIGLSPTYQLYPLLVFWAFAYFFQYRDLQLPVVTRSYERVFLHLCFLCLIVISGIAPVIGRIPLDHIPQASSGLYATYSRGVSWQNLLDRSSNSVEPTGIQEFARNDKQVVFDWNQAGLPVRGSFSVEWRGMLRAPVEGDYSFALESDDGSALLIDGKLMLDNWGDHGPKQVERSFSLTRGQHPIIVRYYNGLFGGLIKLSWRPPNTLGYQVIPEDYLTYRLDDFKHD